MQRRISWILSTLGLALLSACGSSSNSSSNSTANTSAPPGIFYSHNAVFLNNTSVWAWGDNESGQLGNNSTTSSSIPLRVLARFGGYSGNGTSVGSNHSLAFQKYSTIRAWGFNGYGQLGNGVTATNQTPNSWVPVAVRKSKSNESLTGVVAVAAGGYHSLALDRNSVVWSWGNNSYGQLGRQPLTIFSIMSTQTTAPVQIVYNGSPFNGVVSIAAGGSHNLSLKNDGTVWAWGYNGYGQVGDNLTLNSNTLYPVQVPIPAIILKISAGGSHSLALASDGTVWSWGYNYFGQLGDGTTTNRVTPGKVTLVGGTDLTGITMIAAGLDHSLAYDANSDIMYVWGYNAMGQLGDGTVANKMNPAAILNFKQKVLGGTLQTILAVGHHSHASKTDGSWWSWGDNSFGQLGNATSGTTMNSASPVRVKGL